MNRPLFALIVVALVIVVFLAMWLGWRARTKRDAHVRGSAQPPAGELLASFEKLLYVSTTPAGEPLTRVAAPGLRYRGPAEIVVKDDGVSVQVVGEEPVYFHADSLRGAGTAGRRVGKAVEHNGLALMRWESEGRVLESSFRFSTNDEHTRFAQAIDSISHMTTAASVDHAATSQEDAE